MTDTLDPHFSAEELRQYQARKAQEGNGRDEFGRWRTEFGDEGDRVEDDGRVAGTCGFTSRGFVSGFKPPNYLLDGILQRGFCYSLTAPTGAGKTAIALRLMASVAMGRAFAGRDVEQGHVLMLVGENPDDVRMRWIALAEQASFDADTIPVTFIPGVFSIADKLREIAIIAKTVGGLALVVVDTSAAYFQGDDENSNKELGDHARVIRSLTRLPGHPCVVTNSHPVKNATKDNLAPRGGGAFLNEMDGNLTAWNEDAVVELHWQQKFRGPDFDMIPLELPVVTSPKLVTAKGKLMPTVIARPLSDIEASAKSDATHQETRKLLAVMSDHPDSSTAAWADAVGWRLRDGTPHKVKVGRLLKLLSKNKMATKELGTWRLTPSGEKAAKRHAKCT